MSQELVHITVGYPRKPMMDLLDASSQWNGCRFVVLPQHWGASRFSMFSKETMVKAYLETGAVDMGSVILFTDAYDILLVEHGSTILEKFYASGADLIFAAETNFFPTTPDGREEAKAKFDAVDRPWRYLNGGGWIGYAWAVKQMVDNISDWVASKNYDPSWENNDQPFLQDFYLNNLASTKCCVMLDTEPSIFCCLYSHIDEFVVHRGRVRHRRSGKPISILHANGDKHNLNILSRYWALCGGAAGVARLHDLRVVTIDGQITALHPERQKLAPSNNLDPAIVVFLVKGDQQALAFSPRHGLLSFSPGGIIGTGAQRVDVWEVFDTRAGNVPFHGRTLDAYCLAEPGQTVALAPLSLQSLLSPAFDDLMEHILQFEIRV